MLRAGTNEDMPRQMHRDETGYLSVHTSSKRGRELRWDWGEGIMVRVRGLAIILKLISG